MASAAFPFSVLESMSTPSKHPSDDPQLRQDELSLVGGADYGKCRYCGQLNLLELPPGVKLTDLSTREYLMRYDCCTTEPVSMAPFDCLSDAGKERRLALLSELTADEERFRARWPEG